MASALPSGDPVPADGSLPASVLDDVATAPLSFYLHVPFCSTRCGYCDFNTYTPDQLDGSGVRDWLRAAHAEIDLARRVLGPDTPAVQTVFFGGGTPTLVPGDHLTGLVEHVRDSFGLADDAEVTTEGNPENITPELLDTLRSGGINRLSMGMQSAMPHVLRVLDRVHTPGRALAAVDMARDAGFDDVSLDLIYGTPGESLDDWRASLEAALSASPDHLSCYALIVEDGTRLASTIRRGRLPMTDDDDLADKYLLAEDLLSQHGYDWYEVSNWARGRDHRARHNLAYWQGANWWGIGPGAHSHVGGMRWWNLKHPRRYAQALDAGTSPGAGRELVDADSRHVERVLLELRLADGLPLDVLTPSERGRVAEVVSRGLGTVLPDAGDERLALTLEGRLLADAVVRDLLD